MCSHSGSTVVLLLSSQYIVLVSETLDCFVYICIYEMPIYIDNNEMLSFVEIYDLFFRYILDVDFI